MRPRKPAAAAIPLAAPAGRARAASRAGLGLGALIERERAARRPFLLAPVLVGAGILLYFAADAEPAPWAVALALAIAVGLAIGLRRGGAATPLAAVALVIVGFAAGALRTGLAGTPPVPHPVLGVVEGRIAAIERESERLRIRLAPTAFAREGGGAEIRLEGDIRLGMRRVEGEDGLAAGDAVACRVRLLPPPEAALPGGYDFRLNAFFDGVAAVGSTIGPCRRLAGVEGAPVSIALAAAIETARDRMTERILDVVGGQAGALSASLVTGRRDALDDASNEALRAAGVYHIVSISGLHMALATGVAFLLARLVLAAFPVFAQRHPAKKIAAAAALLVACAYCLFSGAEVATVRSLLMTGAMLVAVLFDRPALSMRNVALAALAILLVTPETLLGPSFQMSFGAVAALIAFYERPRMAKGVEARAAPALRVLAAMRRGVTTLLLTTLIATLATAPFGVAHFGRVNPLGVIGNAVVVPVVSMLMMPAGVVGAMLYPFGLDRPFWLLMGQGAALSLSAAADIAALPGAVTAAPSSTLAFALFAIALLVGVLPVTRLRLAAVPVAALGILAQAMATHPQIVVAADGRSALTTVEGELVHLGARPSPFVADQWIAALGGPSGAAMAPSETCDALGCVARGPGGVMIAHLRDPAGFEDDCRLADILVTPLPAPAWCRPRKALIDRRFLDRHGATAIRIGPDGAVALITDRSGAARRPWTPPGPQ